MNNKNASAGALSHLLGIACIALCVWLITSDHAFWATVCCVAAVCFLTSAKTKDSKELIGAQTAEYLKTNPTAKDLVDEVIACADVDTILNSKDFSDRGVNLVSIDPKDAVNLVLTRDCLYDGVFNGYRAPSDASKDVRFCKGEEFQATQRVKMDEGRMAAAGYMAGGLGVAAMNVASAREANAQGGAIVGVKSGNHRFMLSVRKDTAHVWALLIRKDLVQKFGNPFGACRMREGKYYNVYYCQILPAAQCLQSANEMTAMLQKIILAAN